MVGGGCFVVVMWRYDKVFVCFFFCDDLEITDGLIGIVGDFHPVRVFDGHCAGFGSGGLTVVEADYVCHLITGEGGRGRSIQVRAVNRCVKWERVCVVQRCNFDLAGGVRVVRIGRVRRCDWVSVVRVCGCVGVQGIFDCVCGAAASC